MAAVGKKPQPPAESGGLVSLGGAGEDCKVRVATKQGENLYKTAVAVDGLDHFFTAKRFHPIAQGQRR